MKGWIAISALGLVLLGAIGWRLEQKASATADQAKVRDQRKNAPVPVSVVTASRRDIVESFESIGNVEAPFNVKIAPKTSGRIDFLELREGDPVKVGQVLARMDTSQIEAQVHQQEAQVAEARYRLAQARLNQDPTNVTASSQLRQQEAAVSTSTALLRQATENDISERASAEAGVSDAQGKVNAATAAVANAEASIRSAQANVENARAKFNRADRLFKKGFIAEQDVDDTRTTVKVQESALDEANGQLASAKAQKDSALAQLKSAQQAARIAATKGRTDIVAAKAQLKQANANLATARANTAQGPAFRQNVAALQATVEAAVAQLRSAQSQLSDTVLRSPVNGFVTARYLDPGAVASPTQPILGVQAMRQVYVNVPAPEDVANLIRTGDPSIVRIDSLPGKTFAGRVAQVNPAADPTSRQSSVRMILDNPRGLLKPGMFARVSIVTRRIKGALVIPREAVTQSPDGPTVAVIADETASVRPVTTGAGDSNGLAITSGLQPGEQVVVLSPAPIKDGQKVRLGGDKGKRGQGGKPAGK